MSEPANDIEQLSFEDAMKELQKAVEQLERGEVPLDQSIKLYERGAALKAHCAKLLKAAEERVDKITLDTSGQPTGTTPAEGL